MNVFSKVYSKLFAKSSTVFLVIVSGFVVAGFQNCAEGVSKPKEECDSLSSSRVQASSFIVSEGRSEVHQITSDEVLQLHVPKLDARFSPEKTSWNGQAAQVVIAGKDLVWIEADHQHIRELARLKLGVVSCEEPFRGRAMDFTIAGFRVIDQQRVEFVGCDHLKIASDCEDSSSNSNRSSQGRSSSSSGYRSLGSLTRDRGDSAGSGSSSGEVSGRIGNPSYDCAGLRQGETAWEYYNSTTVPDPVCRGVRVRYITTTYEREVRCVDGDKVPTGQTRESSETVGSC